MLQSRPPRQVNRCPQASPYLCRNMWPRDATPSLSSDPSFVFRRLASWRNKIKYWVHSRSLITASFQFSLDLIRLPSTKLFFPFELFAEYVELRCTLCRYVFFRFFDVCVQLLVVSNSRGFKSSAAMRCLGWRCQWFAVEISCAQYSEHLMTVCDDDVRNLWNSKLVTEQNCRPIEYFFLKVILRIKLHLHQTRSELIIHARYCTCLFLSVCLSVRRSYDGIMLND